MWNVTSNVSVHISFKEKVNRDVRRLILDHNTSMHVIYATYATAA